MNAPKASRQDLAVVVVVFGGPSYVPLCLAGLEQQQGVSTFDTVIPCDEGMDEVASLARRYPQVRFPRLSGRRTYAELRAAGLRATSSSVVAFTEDHCTPEPGWCAGLLAAHRGAHAAVGGVVAKGADSSVNWAAYLCDFGRYAPPQKEGPVESLTDCNVSYKRKALDLISNVWAVEFHETAVHSALSERGETLWLAPDAVVRQQRSVTLRSVLRERFEFGRLFASTRAEQLTLQGRFLYTAGAALLPGLLTGRIAAGALERGGNLASSLAALPTVLLLNTCWAAGEFVGYVTGVPGPSLRPQAASRLATPA